MAECPTCGRIFDDEKGMKVHHAHSHGESIAGEPAKCGNCGTSIRVRQHELDKYGAVFCDSSCQSEWQSEFQSGERNPNWKGGLVEVKCANCGKPKEVISAVAEKNDRNFCNYSCYGDWRSETIRGENHPYWKGGSLDVVCYWCGSPAGERSPYDAENSERHFCSKGCLAEWRSNEVVGDSHPSYSRIETECDQCGDGLVVKRVRYESQNHVFCSRDCYQTWEFEGGTFPYGPGWNEEKKSIVRERDGYQCQHCGMSQDRHIELKGAKLHVHHIIPAREIDDPEIRNGVDNLVTLCWNHHAMYDAMNGLRPDNPTTRSTLT